MLEHDPDDPLRGRRQPARLAAAPAAPHRAHRRPAARPVHEQARGRSGRRADRRRTSKTKASCCSPRACTAARRRWPRSSAATRPRCSWASTRCGPDRTSPATPSSASSSPGCRSRARTRASRRAGGPPSDEGRDWFRELLPARGGAQVPPGVRPPDPHRDRRRRGRRARPPAHRRRPTSASFSRACPRSRSCAPRPSAAQRRRALTRLGIASEPPAGEPRPARS